jgi:multidrug efflux pump subunit AcrA (membrane-fusion protein)
MNMHPNHRTADAGDAVPESHLSGDFPGERGGVSPPVGDAVPESHLSGDGAARPVPARVGQPRTPGWWWYAQGRTDSDERVAQTEIVQRRDFSSEVLATGAVTAAGGSRGPGRGSLVRQGRRIAGQHRRSVTRGQVIAELEKEDLEAVLAQREAELQLARRNLAALHRLFPKEIERASLEIARWQATCTLGEQELARETNLYQQNATSEAPSNRPWNGWLWLKPSWPPRKKHTSWSKLATRRISSKRPPKSPVRNRRRPTPAVQLSYATITAPIDGVIASVSTQEGETVAAGLNAPTFVTIIDLRPIASRRVRGRSGHRPSPPGPGGRVHRRYVSRPRVRRPRQRDLSQGGDPRQRSQLRRGDRHPRSHEGQLRPEMTASVTILLETKTDVLAIPARAVKRQRGKNVVYVAVDGQPEPREITVGWKDGSWIEVLAGLEEGQTIFVEVALDRNPPQT